MVLSGGNVDPLLLMRVIRHGMAAAGRYLVFRARIPDVPGGLAQLLNEIAGVSANVLDVVHERTSASLHLDEVEVQLQVETRGVEHADRVLAHLRGCGYTIHPVAPDPAPLPPKTPPTRRLWRLRTTPTRRLWRRPPGMRQSVAGSTGLPAARVRRVGGAAGRQSRRVADARTARGEVAAGRSSGVWSQPV